MNWRRAAWVFLIVLAVVNVVAQSLNAPRSDDLTFLKWALDRTDDPGTPFFRPPPFPGWRPANAAVWWISARLEGGAAVGPQVSLGVFWLAAWGAFSYWAHLRGGARAGLYAATLLLVSAPFRDLVCWRSWNTTAGELAGIGLALVALELGKFGWAVLCGAIATWFKEPAFLIVPTAAVLVYRKPWVAVAVVALGLPGIRKAVGDDLPLGVSLGGLGEGLLFYVRSGARLIWPLAVFGLIAFDRFRLGWRGYNAVDPGTLAKFALLVASLTFAIVYPTRNDAYTAEAVALGAAFAGSLLANRLHPMAIVAVALASAWSVPNSVENVRWQQARQERLSQQFIALSGNPPPSWKLAADATDDDTWLALRMKYDLGVPEGAGP